MANTGSGSTQCRQYLAAYRSARNQVHPNKRLSKIVRVLCATSDRAKRRPDLPEQSSQLKCIARPTPRVATTCCQSQPDRGRFPTCAELNNRKCQHPRRQLCNQQQQEQQQDSSSRCSCQLHLCQMKLKSDESLIRVVQMKSCDLVSAPAPECYQQLKQDPRARVRELLLAQHRSSHQNSTRHL